MYSFIDDNIDLMVDWWEEVMTRGLKPDINVRLVVKAHIWNNSRQKEHLGKLLFRISRFDDSYWTLDCDSANESKYAEWFAINYQWKIW